MAGTSVAVMAWRNLWRNRRRTILTLVSIAFGTFFAIMMSAMQDRGFADFIDTAARFGSGHVAIQHVEYLDTPTLTRSVVGVAALEEQALRDPRVEKVTARILGQVMLTSVTDSFGALFMAYDPSRETAATLAYLEGKVEGELFTDSSDKGIVLGSVLASNLGVGLGDKVVYTLMDRRGEIVSNMARVKAIVSTGTPSLDAGFSLLALDTVRAVLDYTPDEATRVSVYLEDQRRAAPVARDLLARLGGSVAVLPWDTISPELSAFVAMKVGGARVMEGVLALLIVAGIFNTLFVSVMERLREFGILLAIGWSPGRVFRLVMWESAWLALLGLGAGGLLTLGPYLKLSRQGVDLSSMTGGGSTAIAGVGFDPVFRVGIFPETFAFIVGAVIVATMAAGLYPAWKAGRVEPVETIKLI